MNQGYSNKFFCLNVYILSIFSCLLLEQDAGAESKKFILNTINHQLSLERSLYSPPKASTSAKDLLETGARSQELAQNS
jgi:hypothetical protein